MAKKEKDFWSKIIGVGAIGVGLYIGYRLLTNLFRRPEVEIWRCGNCSGILAQRYDHCPHCRVKIKWPNPNLEGIPPQYSKLKNRAFNITCFILIISFLARIVCIFLHNVADVHLSFLEKIISLLLGVLVGEWIGYTGASSYRKSINSKSNSAQ